MCSEYKSPNNKQKPWNLYEKQELKELHIENNEIVFAVSRNLQRVYDFVMKFLCCGIKLSKADICFANELIVSQSPGQWSPIFAINFQLNSEQQLIKSSDFWHNSNSCYDMWFNFTLEMQVLVSLIDLAR